MSIAPKWEKQTFLGQVLFQLHLPPNSFPSVNFLFKLIQCNLIFFPLPLKVFAPVQHFFCKLKIRHVIACFLPVALVMRKILR